MSNIGVKCITFSKSSDSKCFESFKMQLSHLEVELSSDLLQLSLVGGQLGHLDVHGGTDRGSQVGGAEGEESQTLIV